MERMNEKILKFDKILVFESILSQNFVEKEDMSIEGL